MSSIFTLLLVLINLFVGSQGDIDLNDPTVKQLLEDTYLTKDMINDGICITPKTYCNGTKYPYDRFINYEPFTECNREADKQWLIDFYYATNGPNWRKQDSKGWLTDDNFCNW